MPLQLRIAAHSEVGLVRKNNQDSGYASPHLLVVADGMGGAAAGDLASAVAVDTIRKVDGHTEGAQMLEVLAKALHQANERIADLVDEDYALEGMGTTVTTALFDGHQFGLAHIGDSRAYLLHDSRLERLTHDHSWVQSLVDNGKINEDEAAVHPHRSLLLKVLNGQPANHPDLTLVPVEAGDRLLLCSDGLCGLVDDADIAAALATPDQEAALRRLVDDALDEGGIDNITVILADVVESPEPPAAEGAPLVLGSALERPIPRLQNRVPGPDVSPGDATEASSAGVPGEGQSNREAHTSSPRSGDSAVTDDEARYRPQPPRARARRLRLAPLILAVVVVVAALASAYAWTRTQFYVGTAGTQVAIFQGLDENLPGIRLSRLFEVQPLAVAALPPYYQERVRASIDVADLSAARQTVSELTLAARRCARVLPAATPRVVPTPAASSVRPSLSTRPSPVVRSPVPSSPVRRSTVPSRPVPSSPVPSSSAKAPGVPAPRATPSRMTSSDTATPGPGC